MKNKRKTSLLSYLFPEHWWLYLLLGVFLGWILGLWQQVAQREQREREWGAWTESRSE